MSKKSLVAELRGLNDSIRRAREEESRKQEEPKKEIGRKRAEEIIAEIPELAKAEIVKGNGNARSITLRGFGEEEPFYAKDYIKAWAKRNRFRVREIENDGGDTRQYSTWDLELSW